MTEQKPSFSDAASRTIETRRQELPEDEFKQYLLHFNGIYVAMHTALNGEEDFGQFVCNTLVVPFAIMQRGYLELSEERDVELHNIAHADIKDCLEASKVAEVPTEIVAIIARAEAEGFDVPTIEEIAAVELQGAVDWAAVVAAERFHFQKACADIKKGEIEVKYRRPQEGKNES